MPSDPRGGGRILRLAVPAVLALAAVIVLVSLGNWQLRRLAWKEGLIARATERPHLPPLDLSQAGLAGLGDPSAFLDANEYRLVRLSGEYRANGEVHVFTALSDPRSGPYYGPGFWVLTPFVTSPEGAAVYVNRGFVPDEKKDGYAPPPSGPVSVEGLVRAPELGSAFTPNPDLKARLFYARDPAKIGRLTGIAAAAPFFVDLEAPVTPQGGLPQAGETRFLFPNDHLQYALTWYGLAAALVAVFGLSAWRRLKPRDHDGA